jgi:prepilin-type N-terminal cleavage/methylation domain-containing protein
MFHSHAADRRRGFTLFELLIVLALLVVLLGLALPAVQKVRQAADRNKCSNNLKQLVLACHNCNDTYGKMPPTVGSFPNATSDGTLHFYLLPFVEQDALYNLGNDGAGNFSVWNKNVYSQNIPVFHCPNDASGGSSHLYDGWLATTNYAANFMVFALGGARIPASIPDGTSNTLFFAERYQICNQTPCAWAYSGESEWAPMFAYSSVAKFQLQPAQAQCNPALAQAIHPGGIQVGMGDGSVRSISNSLDSRTWWIAICPNDGLPLGDLP